MLRKPKYLDIYQKISFKILKRNCALNEKTKPSNLLSASLACCISTTLGIILEKNNIESKSFYVDIISKSDVQNNKISTLHCKICLPLIKKLKIKNFIKEKIESSFISNSLKESINISYEYIFNR